MTDLRAQLDRFSKGEDWDPYRRLSQAEELIEEASAALAAAEQTEAELRAQVHGLEASMGEAYEYQRTLFQGELDELRKQVERLTYNNSLSWSTGNVKR